MLQQLDQRLVLRGRFLELPRPLVDLLLEGGVENLERRLELEGLPPLLLEALGEEKTGPHEVAADQDLLPVLGVAHGYLQDLERRDDRPRWQRAHPLPVPGPIEHRLSFWIKSLHGAPLP